MATARIISGQNVRGASKWMLPRLKVLAGILLAEGYSVQFYSVRRSRAEQADRVRSGASTTMNSKHLTGDAADIIILTPTGQKASREVYADAGAVWEYLGGRWGGNFSDPALAAAEFEHFERA